MQLFLLFVFAFYFAPSAAVLFTLLHSLSCYCVVRPDQRNLGMSMRVERSTVDQVKKRFEFNKRKKEEQKQKYGNGVCSPVVLVCDRISTVSADKVRNNLFQPCIHSIA